MDSFSFLCLICQPQNSRFKYGLFPSSELIEQEITALALYPSNYPKPQNALFLETFVFDSISLEGGLMLVGMALYKLGILSQHSRSFYLKTPFIL